MPFKMGSREAERYEEIEGEDGIELVETDEWRSYQLSQQVKTRIRLANLDEPDREYRGPDRLKNLPKIERYVESFIDPEPAVNARFRRAGLYLWSRQNGTQKSTVAKRIGRGVIRAGLSAHMLLMSDLLVALTKKDFDDADPWLLEVVDAVDLLIIDDAFDPKKVTVYKSGYQLPYLDTFLRRRIEANKRAIIFTSNIPIDEIGGTFGPSIQALVRRSTAPLEFSDGIDDFDISDLWR